MDSSEFLGFLTSRSSVREYGSTPITEDEIGYILSCARTAPSAGNLEAWDAIIVTDEDVRLQLADAAFGQEHVGCAPVIFVVCANYVRSMSRYGERGILYAVQDATIAGTYMMLAIHARDLLPAGRAHLTRITCGQSSNCPSTSAPLYCLQQDMDIRRQNSPGGCRKGSMFTGKNGKRRIIQCPIT